jgi:hypothetical protein
LAPFFAKIPPEQKRTSVEQVMRINLPHAPVYQTDKSDTAAGLISDTRRRRLG